MSRSSQLISTMPTVGVDNVTITRKRTITDDVNEGRGLPQAFVDRIITTTEVDGAICYIQGLNREWIVSQVRPAMTRIVIHITEDVTQF